MKNLKDMRKNLISICVLCILTLTVSCVRRSNDKSEKAKTDYNAALNDSIERFKKEIDSCSLEIESLRAVVDEKLTEFTNVSNAREAAPYIIMTTARDKYPLKSTGLIARINDSGQFELIAALSAAPFDRISVTAGSETVDSETVPNDQALNYRTSELTTVSFTGSKADSIGMLIQDSGANTITVNYLNGKLMKTYQLPAEYAGIIGNTYELYSMRRQLDRLEQRVPMLHEKINLLRIHLDKKGSE